MADANTSSEAKAKSVVKSSKSAAAEGGDNKKRFEVKKVGEGPEDSRRGGLARLMTSKLVECRGALGMGHRR